MGEILIQARKRTNIEKSRKTRVVNKIQEKNNQKSRLGHLDQRVYEASAIFLFALTSYLFICLLTYNLDDPGFTHINNKIITNYGGQLGAWFSDIMYYFFGYLSYWIPVSLFYASYASYAKRSEEIEINWLHVFVKALGFLLALLCGAALASLYLGYLLNLDPLMMGPGGLIGKLISHSFTAVFNKIGATVLLAAGFFIGVTLVTGLSWVQALDYIGKQVINWSIVLKQIIFKYLDSLKSWLYNFRNNATKNPSISTSRLSKFKEFDVSKISKISQVKTTDTITNTKPSKLEIIKNNPAGEKSINASSSLDVSAFKKIKNNIEQVVLKPKNLTKAKQLPISSITPDGLPDVSLLEMSANVEGAGYSDAELHDLSRLVEYKLLDFGVEAQVVGVQPGPVVVRFELSLAPGIKVSKVSGLAKDIARSLAIVSVRVVEVIPGKPYVGLEVPNTHREIVRLRELLEHPEYAKNKSPLTLVLGKDISGKIKLADLSKMPHLLVAGTTGSGKSVGVNAMLLSILFKATPKDVRLIMIDPKMLELSVYDGIPHLLAPVVTDMRDAANALKWCVAEMDRRYKLMAALGVRNLASYNRKVEEAQQKNEPILDPLWPADIDEKAPELETLPFIVVIVDEFADMIMVVGRKVEELIARIAQKARAAGIHMILATQRPSVNVITGLIKANIPTRIAF